MFGGLAMFLYGMEVMGEGLKKSSGDTLRVLLQKLTRNTFTGLLTGMLVTAIIQASSATIVLTVGLLAAGILTPSASSWARTSAPRSPPRSSASWT